MSKKRKVFGSKQRPRLSVYRSLKHIHVQLIDDLEGKTLAAVSGGRNVAAAKVLGKEVAKAAKEKGIKKVVFDRGRCLYHGKVKALADAAREEGLEF